MGDFESLITKEPVEENSGDGSLSLSVGAHWGTWGGGSPFPKNFKRYMEGSGKGASLSVGAVTGTWRGPPFVGIQKDMGRRAQGTDITLRGGPTGEFGRGLAYWRLEKALETGTFLHRGPVKESWGVRSPETQRDNWRTLETEHPSLWALCEGNLVGEGVLYWGPWRLCRRRLWWRAPLSIGAPLGNLEGGPFTRDFEW